MPAAVSPSDSSEITPLSDRREGSEPDKSEDLPWQYELMVFGVRHSMSLHNAPEFIDVNMLYRQY